VSFFDDDEPDEPTRVTRPARPRRAATAARAPSTAGGPPPDLARRRQAILLGSTAVVLILLIIGVNSCLDSRHERSLKDYNREVSSIVESSDSQVSRQLFDVLEGGGAANDLQVAVNQVRLVAEEDVKRAKALDVPGDMKAAQRNLELVLNLRADGVRKIADLLPTALSTQAGAQDALRKVSGEMQAFLGSDVVYSQRVAPLIKQTLDDDGIAGQRIAQSKFLPSLGWLDAGQVAQRLNPDAANGTATPNGIVAPGLHGHGLVSTSVGGITLQPGEVVNRIPASQARTFDVTIANQGENDEQNVKVTIRITGAGKPISVSKTINQTRSGTNAEVPVTLNTTPPTGRAVTIEVAVAPVPGEKKTDNNKQTYTALFTP
jgi:hypothetical protein